MQTGRIRRFVPSPRFALVPLAVLTIGAGFLPTRAHAAAAAAPSPSVVSAPVDSPDFIVLDQHPRTRRDIDGDGIPNRRDRDVDGDGIPNRRDRDIDGDGIPNRRDRDMDGDGIPNRRDRDMDGDGRANRGDAHPGGPGSHRPRR
jgi:hypothetical protein